MDERPHPGTWLIEAAAIAGLVISLANYFTPGNGLHGTPGALLVVISTVLMLLAAGALMVWPGPPRWRRGLLLVLIALDILGTGTAAYFLEAYWLIAAMVLALIGWLFQVAATVPSNRMPANAAASRGA